MAGTQTRVLLALAVFTLFLFAIYLHNRGGDPRESDVAHTEVTLALVQGRALCVHPTCGELIPQHPPMMASAEFRHLATVLREQKPERYLEIGSGHSTSLYPPMAARSWVVDNYQPWCDVVQERPVVRCLRDKGVLQYNCLSSTHSEIKLGDLGVPASASDYEAMGQAYLGAVAAFGAEAESFDVALVDGRYRVACALRLLTLIHDSSLVILHDFWNRPQYHAVLDFYNVVSRKVTLVVLSRKPTAELPAGWERAYQAYVGTPD